MNIKTKVAWIGVVGVVSSALILVIGNMLIKKDEPKLTQQPTIINNNYNIQNPGSQKTTRSEADGNSSKPRASFKPGVALPKVPNPSRPVPGSSGFSTSPDGAAKIITNTDVWKESSPMISTESTEKRDR